MFVGEHGPETVDTDGLVFRGAFTNALHPRGTGAQGGQFVTKGASGDNDTVAYDQKTGRGAGYGVKGGDKRVKQLQAALNRLGFKDANGNPLLVDGKLGPRTTAAIKRLQKRLGLPADGHVSPALLKKIKGASGPKGFGKRAPKKAVAKKAAHKATAPAKKAAAPVKTAKPSKRTYSGHS